MDLEHKEKMEELTMPIDDNTEKKVLLPSRLSLWGVLVQIQFPLELTGVHSNPLWWHPSPSFSIFDIYQRYWSSGFCQIIRTFLEVYRWVGVSCLRILFSWITLSNFWPGCVILVVFCGTLLTHFFIFKFFSKFSLLH